MNAKYWQNGAYSEDWHPNTLRFLIPRFINRSITRYINRVAARVTFYETRFANSKFEELWALIILTTAYIVIAGNRS